jgi:hypothetical protein
MIDPISDTIFEFDETVIATLATASDGGTITQGTATGTISNDDPISRVSVDSNELQAVGPGYNNPSSASYNSSISADGRYVTFFSNSPNLVADDTNNIRDIFVRDLLLGTTTRVGVNSDEGQGTTSGYTAPFSNSYAPSISADGRFVTFFSEADNLVPDDTNSAKGTCKLARPPASTSLPMSSNRPKAAATIRQSPPTGASLPSIPAQAIWSRAIQT